MPRVSLYLKEEELEFVDEEAAGEDGSVSGVIRELINEERDGGSQ